ncbi:MAG: lipid-A-disaccharide synthase [Candidatus Omnitrophica bacterium]|nr:lipid-A-disaccharide synthase [Candidatus Omnitrophota bacterium]
MKIVIVAGDPSGDLHGLDLARKIKELNPDIELYCAGGENLARQCRQIVNLTEIAVTGIFEVVSYFRKILRIFNLLVKRIKELRPQAVVLIDFPDFNLRLAKKLKNKDLKIFYYISPQVWAWRKNRIKTIKKYLDKMLVIFPFEEDFYKVKGIKARYVGHPLVELINNEKEKNRNSKPEKIIAFLPGSREKEVRAHLGLMLKAKDLLKKEGFKFVIIKHPELKPYLFSQAREENIEVTEDKFKTLSKAYMAVSSSGTATLELALLNIPTIVIYKIGFLSWLLLKNMVKVNFISMPNIIAGEKVFPELIQYQASSENIASYCKVFIENTNLFNSTKEKLKKVKEALGSQPASLNAARQILNELKSNR